MQTGNGLGMSLGFSVINWVFTTQESKKDERESVRTCFARELQCVALC